MSPLAFLSPLQLPPSFIPLPPWHMAYRIWHLAFGIGTKLFLQAPHMIGRDDPNCMSLSQQIWKR